MKVRLVGLAMLCCAVLLMVFFSNWDRGQSQTSKAVAQDSLSQDERDLLSEINQARAHPLVYAGYLEKLKPYFSGKDYKPPGTQDGFKTEEGWSAVDDAIKFLKATKPL